MPVSKSEKAVTMSQQSETVYPTERLLKSKCLSEYQPDFARAILTEPEYTISGAKAALDAVLKGGK